MEIRSLFLLLINLAFQNCELLSTEPKEQNIDSYTPASVTDSGSKNSYESTVLPPGDIGHKHCTDGEGKIIPHGDEYTPNLQDPCTRCQCDNDYPILCHTAACSTPQGCARLEPIPAVCCQYHCLDANGNVYQSPPGNISTTVNGSPGHGVSLGDSCDSTHDQCVQNATCSSGICRCTEDYYDNNGVCNPRVAFGSRCNAHNQCQTPNAVCLVESRTYICGCGANFYFENNQCKLQIGLGHLCTQGKSSSQCLNKNAVCKQTTYEGDYKCLCRDTHFNDSGICSTRLELDAICTQNGPNDQCRDDNAICKEDYRLQHKCMCRDTHYKDGRVCKERIRLGLQCTVNQFFDQCLDKNAQCRMVSRQAKCICNETFYNLNGECKRRLELDYQCSQNGPIDQCLENAVCKDFKNRHLCTCNDTHYSADRVCTERLELNAQCNQKGPIDQCRDVNAVCKEIYRRGPLQCLCKDTHYNDGRVCRERVAFGSRCNAHNQCQTPNAVCLVESRTYICGCGANFYFENNQCKLQIGLGHLCTQGKSSSQCLNKNAVCKQTTYEGDYKCLCRDTHFNDSGICSTRLELDALCTQNGPNDQCRDDNAICKEDYRLQHKCMCRDTHYSDGRVCKERIRLGQRCTLFGTFDQCLNNKSECRLADGQEKCVCIPTYYNHNGVCARRLELNAQCTQRGPIDQCRDGNAVCKEVNRERSHQCLCKDTHYNDRRVCRERQGYSSNCTSQDDICQSKFPCAGAEKDVKRCLCPERHFRYNTSCLNEKRLTVSNITMDGVYMETEINVRWTRPLNHSTLIYSVSLSDNSMSRFSYETFAKLTGKTPGTKYIVNVTTQTTKEEFGNTPIKTTSLGIPFYTKPARPGKLTRSEYPANDVNLEFESSAGKVDWYNVTLLPADSRPLSRKIISKPGSTQSVRFPNLAEGKFYNVTIIAGIDRSDTREIIFSTEQTDTFRVKPNVSGPVSQLVIAEKNSRWIVVKWSMPSEPKGFVSGYILQAIDHVTRKCKSGIIWTCRDCNNSKLNIQNLEACTRNTSRDTYVNQVQNASYTFRSNVTDLVPDTRYTVRVQAVNEAGVGSVTDVSTTTEQEHAQDLKNVTVSKTGLGTLCVNWTPGQRTGPTRYNVTWEESADLGSGSFLFKGSHIIEGYENRSYSIQGLLSYWTYRINVQAATDIGPSPLPTTVTAQTLDSRPGPVQNLTIHQPDTTAQFLHLMFKCPDERERNGPIESFEFNSSVIRSESTQPILPDGTVNIEADCDFDVTVNVTAETNYSFSVYAKTSNYHGLLSTQFAFVKPKVPLLAEHKSVLATVDVARSTETSVSVDVCRCLVDTKEGQITMAGFVVCRKSEKESCQPEPGPRNRTYYENLLTWKKFKTAGETGRYRTTPEYFHDIVYNESASIKSRDRASTDGQARFTYIIGTDNCHQRSSDEFCNGYLPSGSQLNLIIFACTRGGCSESPYAVQIETKATEESDIGPVVGGVFAAILITAIAVAIIFYLHRNARKAVVVEAEDCCQTFQRKTVKLQDFATYLEKCHADSNLLFQEEFSSIVERSPKTYSTEVATLDANKMKNRYVNILAYDHSRVKLTPDDDDLTSDFINANYIPGFTSPREYIATQGPLVSTVDDFWRMMWEQKSGIIIMLSDLMEKRKPKVDLYWPTELNAAMQYGNIIVEMTACSTLNKYTLRNFKVSNEYADDTRCVVQYFLPGWEDYGANLQPQDILDFLKVVRQAAYASRGPIVVHCSAGVGRTGTFIALDYLMQFVQENDLDSEVDIYNLVLNMRHYRPLMVQSEKQYIFIHDVLKMLIDEKIKGMQDEMKDNIYANEITGPASEEYHLYENTQLLFNNTQV